MLLCLPTVLYHKLVAYYLGITYVLPDMQNMLRKLHQYWQYVKMGSVLPSICYSKCCIRDIWSAIILDMIIWFVWLQLKTGVWKSLGLHFCGDSWGTVCVKPKTYPRFAHACMDWWLPLCTVCEPCLAKQVCCHTAGLRCSWGVNFVGSSEPSKKVFYGNCLPYGVELSWFPWKSAKLTETCDRTVDKGQAAVLCVGHAAISIKSMKSDMRPDNSIAFLEETLQSWTNLAGCSIQGSWLQCTAMTSNEHEIYLWRWSGLCTGLCDW